MSAASDPKVMSVSDLLRLHPWPAAHAAEKRLEWLWHFDLPGTPEDLWRLVTDTTRGNRAMGGAEMKFEERDGKRWGTARNGGVLQEWIEVPWSWVGNQWLTCTRLYERGFSRVMYAVYRLEPIATGTRFYVYFGFVPRNLVGSLALRFGFPTLESGYRRILPAMAAQLDRLVPDVLVAPPPELPDDVLQRLAAQRETLVKSGLSQICVDALVDWIRTGDEADLHRIQIRERARVWRLPEADLLRVALHATRAGLLTLSWDTICPHCRGVRDENADLQSLRATARCDVCDIDFGTDSPEAVEVTFHVHSSIRDVAERLYCSAEPATKEHVRVQLPVAPGERVELQPRLAPGRYRLRAGKEPAFYLDIVEGGSTRPVRFGDHAPGAVVEAGSDAQVEIENGAADAKTFVIERATWSDDALRPGQLLGHQDFRDLFSEAYIGADVRLGIGEQTILFTDVVGSTAFYASRGDPAAFVDIKRHFDDVFAVVRRNRGAVVKTIGDAVMATFVNPADAVRASREIHDAFRPDRADTPIRLRISLNTGPCIAVHLNAGADFFGGTVNVAAKLQSLVEAYQIAMSEATYRSPGVAEYCAEQGASLDELRYSSKALPAPIGVRRWTVYP
ncbi:Adenylate cyclase [Minicystis rosea]|nr:Adenylate cyclase [Minicystis rosea]